MSWLKELFVILKTVGSLVLTVLIVNTAIDQFLNHQLQELLLSEDGGGARIWLLAGASLLNGLIFPVLVVALSLFGILRSRGSVETLGGFFSRILNQLYIETLRAWGSALRWAILLILPAFVRLFQLVFVPFIVALHRPYELGDADALTTSRKYVHRQWFKVAIAVFAFYLLIPLLLTDLLDPWRSYAETPATAFVCSLVDLFVAVVSAQIFFRLFEAARKEFGDESVLSLERH